MSEEYERLKEKVRRRQMHGDLPYKVSAAERADWAYGNAVFENDEVTREMAEQAARVGSPVREGAPALQRGGRDDE